MDKPRQFAEDAMNDPMTAIAADLIDRLSRIETTLTALDKTVRGNGKPGLIDRVDDLEKSNDIKSGASTMKTKVLAVVISIMLGLLSLSVSLSISHGNKEDAEREAHALYQQKQDLRIQTLEIRVAVLMAGLRGDAGDPGPSGPKGKRGVKGRQGEKGDKGGIKLFSK